MPNSDLDRLNQAMQEPSHQDVWCPAGSSIGQRTFRPAPMLNFEFDRPVQAIQESTPPWRMSEWCRLGIWNYLHWLASEGAKTLGLGPHFWNSGEFQKLSTTSLNISWTLACVCCRRCHKQTAAFIYGKRNKCIIISCLIRVQKMCQQISEPLLEYCDANVLWNGGTGIECICQTDYCNGTTGKPTFLIVSFATGFCLLILHILSRFN